MPDEALADMLCDQRRMDLISQVAGGELSEGARESRFAGHLARVLPAADAQQARLRFEHLNQKRAGGQIVDGLSDEGPCYRPPILTRTAQHLNLARRHMVLDADDLEDRHQLVLLLGELGLEAAFQMREQDRLNVAPDAV